MNSKLNAVCDGEGRSIILLLTEGQMSDHKGAASLLSSLPNARELLGDKGYDSDWFRHAFEVAHIAFAQQHDQGTAMLIADRMQLGVQLAFGALDISGSAAEKITIRGIIIPQAPF